MDPDLDSARRELTRLAERGRRAAQGCNDSAAPELLDGFEELLRRLETWQAAAARCPDAEERVRLLEEARSLQTTFRRLPFTLDTP